LFACGIADLGLKSDLFIAFSGETKGFGENAAMLPTKTFNLFFCPLAFSFYRMFISLAIE
jgi:hypothetical protein